jgi:transposase
MRRIEEVLRMVLVMGLGVRQAARACGISRSTAADYVARARLAKMTAASLAETSNEELSRLLFPAVAAATVPRAVPQWPEVQEELRRKGVTLQLLWEEYRQAEPDGYAYSRYCDLYRAWRGRQDLVMRQDHKAGERLFVDYAGQTLPIVDPQSGETRQAQVFVAVHGASSYCYAEATFTQALPDWIDAHVRAFTFFGGVPLLVVVDNLKSGVSRACRYDPEMNPTYRELAAHYGVAVTATRPVKPRDKAKVEAGVQVVERWIMARLRKQRFFSLAEANAAILELLTWLNDRPFKKRPGSRREAFERIDRPALRPLPAQPYERAHFLKTRVGLDYHVTVEGHAYSVPYQLVGREVDVRITARGVEVLAGGRRVCAHGRSEEVEGRTTLLDHMPRSHREQASWTPERLLSWAAKSGSSIDAVITTLLSKAHPLHSLRPCLGIQRLGERFGVERLDAACERAIRAGTVSYRSLRSMLVHRLEHEPLAPLPEASPPARQHAHVRGADYYAESPPC